MPGVEIVRRLYEEHQFRGGKSAVYELVRRLRPVTAAPVVRFEGVPGEFSQHDFGQVDIRYDSGAVERVHFLASRLKWSRFVHVVVVPDERQEALVRALLASFEAFGGVALVTVWDTPKTVVVSRKGELIVWNPVFGQVALDAAGPDRAARDPMLAEVGKSASWRAAGWRARAVATYSAPTTWCRTPQVKASRSVAGP